MTFDFHAIVQALPQLVDGAEVTLEITIAGLLIGFILGVASGISRLSSISVLRLASISYVNLIRGTPLVVQVMFIYFALPLATGVGVPMLAAGIGAISINSGAYISEIVRGGLLSIDRGLLEAGQALGVSRSRIFISIIWPIAFRRMLPALGNQLIISLKDTSILIVIGVGELTRKGQEIIATNFRALEIWTAVAIMYFIMTGTLSIMVHFYERRKQMV
jgi:glutamine transport system permease protein